MKLICLVKIIMHKSHYLPSLRSSLPTASISLLLMKFSPISKIGRFRHCFVELKWKHFSLAKIFLRKIVEDGPLSNLYELPCHKPRVDFFMKVPPPQNRGFCNINLGFHLKVWEDQYFFISHLIFYNSDRTFFPTIIWWEDGGSWRRVVSENAF